MHRYKAYVVAVNSLKAHPKEVPSGKEAKKLKGIGVKICKKIQEIIDTGRLQKLEKEKANPVVKAIGELTKILGVGPVAALKWVKADGVTGIKDLKEKVKEGKIVLTHQQEIGLKYFDDLHERIPREEMTKMADLVIEAVKEVDPKIVCECCGSYRRGLPSSGDVDILLTHPKFTNEKKKKKKPVKSYRISRISFMTKGF